MDLSRQESNTGDNLNDSWVELDVKQQQHLQRSQLETPPLPQSIHSDAMEKLLLEAQRESKDASRASSRASSHNSPKGPHSPKSEDTPSLISITENQGENLTSIVKRELGTEWVWDWSSRPECIPPSEHGKQFKRPVKRGKLSVRNHELLSLSYKSLSFLIISHLSMAVVGAALGAALVSWWVKKPCVNCGAD